MKDKKGGEEMIEITRNAKKESLGYSLPITISSVKNISGKINGEGISLECTKLIIFQQAKQKYLAIIGREKGRARKVLKIFQFPENVNAEDFTMISRGICEYTSMSCSLGNLKVYFLNKRIEVGEGVDVRLEKKIKEAVEKFLKDKTAIKVIKRKKGEV